MNKFAASACIAAFALAACGGNTTPTTPPPPKTVTPLPTVWTLQAGASSQKEAYQGLQFYPASITVDVGDTITWNFPAGEPHTVTFLGPRKAPPPPNDPSVSKPAGGSTYDGSTYTSSGFVLLGGSYSLTFKKAGTYTYYCLIHGPEMVGTVKVQAAGSPYPQTQSQLDAKGASMIHSDLTDAFKSVGEFPYVHGGLHLAAGISKGLVSKTPATSSVMRFLTGSKVTDTTATIHAGQSITWTNLSSNMPHTVTFAPVGQPFPTLNPFSPPSGGNTYDGSTLVNSGPLFPGQSFTLKFTKAGTYTNHCIFHDDTENMIETVIVK